jgi:hypothetical protein
MEDYQKELLNAIDIRISKNNDTLAFDKTYRGIVESVTSSSATIIINEETYSAKVPNTLTLYVGDIVSVNAIGNNFSDLLVEEVLNGQGGYLSSGSGNGTSSQIVAPSSINGNIKIDNVETVVYTHPSGTNPHGTTKSDIGLNNVDNVQQATKEEFNTHNIDNTRHITSTERTTWNTVGNKVDKVVGKQLSTEDYTTTEKTKLSNIADYANNYIHPSTHSVAMITGLSTVATSGSYNDLTNQPILGTVASKNTGTTSGTVPIIGADGKLDISIMPSIVITDTFVVASQSAMLALTAEIGDVCIRTDLNKSFILRLSPASTLSNWQELLTPTDLVQSINGKTGVVTLTASDVSLGNVTNESKATMFTNPTFTGTVTAPTPTSTDNTTKVATTAFVKNQGYMTGINSTNVINALGYTPLSSIPIASDTFLGGIKVGANLTITEDGTLNANDNPASFIKKQERFVKTTGQTIYNLTQGHYQPLTGAISWFLNGAKQSDSILQQLSSTSIGLPSTIGDGSVVLLEYYEVINWYPFPTHANEHLTGGVDAIPLATTTTDGLMSSTDRISLANATNTNIVSTLVKRDSSGNFSAGTITATLSGNASTSTKLATARTIAMTSGVTGSAIFDGGGDVTITAIVTADGHNHTKIKSIDDRDVKPTDTNKGYATLYFASLNGLNGTTGGSYQDLLTLNTWTDTSGGKINALSFDKTEMKIRHYQANQGDTVWGTARELAYIDSNVSTASKLLNPKTIATTGDITGTATSFDGSANIIIPTTLASIVTAGTATKITYDDKGRVTSSTNLSASDIPTVTSSKISDFASSVLSTVLTGLSTATNAVISATDSVLIALGKLQKQITDNLATLTSHTGNTSNPHNTTASQVGLGNVDNTADANKNVLSATKWTTARTFSLTGDVTGSVSIDGSSNPSITTTVADDSHNHTEVYVKADNYKDGIALPSTYPRGTCTFFSNNPANKFNSVSYCTIVTIKGYSNMACVQYIYPYNVDAPISYRYGLYNSDSWTSWRTISVVGHTHTKSEITDMPTKLSQFTNDISAGGGISTIVSTTTQTTSKVGNVWIKPI